MAFAGFVPGSNPKPKKITRKRPKNIPPKKTWTPRPRYLYDLRWVTGWQSVYGYSSGHGRGEDADEFFIQIWASQPQYVGLMAHLLQQGAVLSTSFQPFEVHLPYLLHFLDSFGLGGMRELVVDPTRIALRGELPEQALSTFPWHPLWVSKLGSGARERLLRRRLERPWWCDRAASERRPGREKRKMRKRMEAS